MIKRGVPLLLAFLLFAGISSCNPNETKTAAQQLDNWFSEVKPGVTQLDTSENQVVHFQVSRPPSVSALEEVSRVGLEAGDSAKQSADGLFEVTDLTKQEVKGLYCYLFSWYVENGTVPNDPLEFEEAFFGYLQGRAFPSTPIQRLEGIANLFRESIVNAQSEGEASARVAVASVCSMP